MIKYKELMFGRIGKDIVLIFMGGIIGAFTMAGGDLSSVDVIITVMGAFVLLWDFCLWASVFIFNKKEKKK